jgi:hypothetical protein
MTSMTLQWSHPSDNGGCAITSYAVFRDDGADGDISVEANADFDTNVRDRPTLDQLLVTNFPVDSAGLTFRFTVVAYNHVGSTTSNSASYILASVPTAPVLAPDNDPDTSDDTQIKVDFAALSLQSETGGSTILSYNLQMDQSDGVFEDLFGVTQDVLTTTSLVTSPSIVQGTTYGFRYRARNIYGWSDWSPTTYILAARVPDAPPKPEFVSATDNSISLQLYPSPDFGGSTVTRYELWMDQGSEDSEYSQVSSYVATSLTMTHSVQWPTDSIVTGQVYSFKFLAENSKGVSEFSEIVSIAAIDPPAQASTPVIDYELSSSTSIFVSWQRNTDGEAPGGLITGYSLFMDDGYGGKFTEILNTVGTSPLISEHLATDLSQSLTYKFKVVAYNYNTEAG